MVGDIFVYASIIYVCLYIFFTLVIVYIDMHVVIVVIVVVGYLKK